MNKGARSTKRRQFDLKFKRDLIVGFDKLQSKGKVKKSLFSLNNVITPFLFTTILAQRDKLFKVNKKGIVGDTKWLGVCLAIPLLHQFLFDDSSCFHAF